MLRVVPTLKCVIVQYFNTTRSCLRVRVVTGYLESKVLLPTLKCLVGKVAFLNLAPLVKELIPASPQT